VIIPIGHAGVAVLTDDDMIAHGNAEGADDPGDLPCRLDVGGRPTGGAMTAADEAG
jgi:hypothetical protein